MGRLLKSVILALAVLPSVPCFATTTFQTTVTTLVMPGQINFVTGEVLDTRVKGTVRTIVLTLEPIDKGRVLAVSGTLSEYSESMCVFSDLSFGSCSNSAVLQGEGQVVGCSIPITGRYIGDCDVYYKTDGTTTFFFTNFVTSSGCNTFPCSCT